MLLISILNFILFIVNVHLCFTVLFEVYMYVYQIVETVEWFISILVIFIELFFVLEQFYNISLFFGSFYLRFSTNTVDYYCRWQVCVDNDIVCFAKSFYEMSLALHCNCL